MRLIVLILLIFASTGFFPVNSYGDKQAKKTAPIAPIVKRAKRPVVRTLKKKSLKQAKRVEIQKQPSSKPTKVTPKVKKPIFKYPVDKSVHTLTLSNGMRVWCKPFQSWGSVQVKLAIAAGTSFDPLKKAGRARFFVRLLESELNRAQNPANPPFAPGKGVYEVALKKDWITISIRTEEKELKEVFRHITNVLTKSFLKSPTKRQLKTLKASLKRSAGRFPAPTLPERIDSFLFPGLARAAFLRGKKRHFRRIDRKDLEKAFQSLLKGERMRLLLLGSFECQNLPSLLKQSLEKVKGKEVSLEKIMGMSPDANQRGRFLAPQTLVQLYQLPSLQARDVLALTFIKDIALRELRLATRTYMGRELPIRTHFEWMPSRGYLFFSMPTPPAREQRLKHLVRKTLGRLLVDPYDPPELKHRVKLHHKESLLALLQRIERPSQQANLLFTQLLLAKKGEKPLSAKGFFQQIEVPHIRVLARKYLSHNLSMSRVSQSFSLQQVGFFIATLLLVWFTLDLFLRRGRRYDK